MGGKVQLADAVKVSAWRKFFQDSRKDIFEIIEGAITVAAWSHGDEFFARRDHIEQILYAVPNPNESLQLVQHLSDSEEEQQEQEDSHSHKFFQRRDQITPVLSSKKNQNKTSSAERTPAAVAAGKACNRICLNEEEMELKLEATRKKLRQRYEQLLAEKTRKKIQVIDPKKLPPQDAGCRKSKNQSRRVARRRI